MKRLIIVAASVVLVATAAVVAADRAQFQLPRLPGNLPTTIPNLGRLPSLGDLFGANPVTSTLNDAVTDVPFLDRFDPQTAAPLLELPFGFDDGLTLVPGLWEAEVQSYCMMAGTYGPTRGDGYLWAPWKGPKADVVTTILNKSVLHPELPQQDIQELLWGILARTKVSTLPEGAKAAAASLLTRAQLASIDGSALDVIPADWLDRITGPVAGPVRRVLEAENRMREVFANPGGAAYDELEEIAVLHGAPPAGERGREVPAGRWSYLPSGVFIRYLPRDYTDTVLQLYVPEHFIATRDAGGQLTQVRDARGAQLQIAYTDSTISGAMFTPASSGAMRPLSLVPASGQTAVAARTAVDSAVRLVPSARRQAPRAQDVAELSQLAVRVQDDPASRFLSRAWASAVGDWARGDGGAAAAAFDRFHYATVSLGWIASRPNIASVVNDIVPENGAQQLAGQWGGGGGGGFSAGGGGGMPGGGHQRDAPTLRKYSGNNAADRARKAVELGKKALGKYLPGGMDIPKALFGKILDFNFFTWGKASKALQGDPPRSDFREFTKPDIPVAPRVTAGPGLTTAQADHLNAVVRDLVAANAYVRAGLIAIDRHGGAVQAGDRGWASKQAQALIFLKRGAGEQALKVAGDLEALAADAKGLPPITLAEIEGERRRLEAGWTEADKQAAAAAGLTSAELEEIRTARLALDEPSDTMTPEETLMQMAAEMREIGARFAALPGVPAPWEGSSATVERAAAALASRNAPAGILVHD